MKADLTFSLFVCSSGAHRFVVNSSSSFSTSEDYSTSTTTCTEDLPVPCTSLSEAVTAVNILAGSIPPFLGFLDGVHVSDDTAISILYSGYSMSRSQVTSSVIEEVVDEGYGISIDTQSPALYAFTVSLSVPLTSPLCTITSTGELSLNNWLFTSSPSLTHSTSISSIDSGSLACSGSEFTSISLQTHSLISVSSDSLWWSAFTGSVSLPSTAAGSWAGGGCEGGVGERGRRERRGVDVMGRGRGRRKRRRKKKKR